MYTEVEMIKLERK